MSLFSRQHGRCGGGGGGDDDERHALVAACAVGLLALAALSPCVAQSEDFVRIVDGQFAAGCERFLVSGWNQWEVVEAASGAPDLIGASIPQGKTGPQMVRDLLDLGQINGFNVMRAWAHTVSPDFALQKSPGEYNEAIFRGLDYVLNEARKRNIRLILSFTDNWPEIGGADEYVKWSPGSSLHTDFFSEPTAQQLYKNHVRVVINRVNTINGYAYRDDPTIMAWNLINEPRCVGCPEELQQWIEEMAAYVKNLDPNHLLTVGLDGFYSTSGKAWANPQGSGAWAELEGQDFIENHKPAEIDFVTFHSWVDNWADVTESFQRSWIREHVADAKAMGKPILLQEFGKIVQPGGPTMKERDQFFQFVYDEVETAIEDGSLQGAMFWQWYDVGQEAPFEEGGGRGRFGIFFNDSTFAQIQKFSDFVRAQNAIPLSINNCKPQTSASSNQCQQTWIDGKEGTGFEGPSCDIDVNECVRGTAGCHANAGCENLEGGFRCKCFAGFHGDGTEECKPTIFLNLFDGMYATGGPGRLACDEGEDVVYPVASPGFVYDPTGSVDRSNFKRGRFGSRTDTTVEDCQIACEMAEGDCDSFAYNPILKQCFLKRCPSADTCQGKETFCRETRTQELYSCGVWQTYFHKQRFQAEKCPK